MRLAQVGRERIEEIIDPEIRNLPSIVPFLHIIFSYSALSSNMILAETRGGKSAVFKNIVIFAVLFYEDLAYNNINKYRGDLMPNIKPVSDLRNYNEVLKDVAVGEPVFLTKNGRGRYAIIDIADYERTQATIKLMNELAKGRKSGEEQGWLSHEEVRTHFNEKLDE
jgi:prevent-host-death family protein